MTFDAPLHEQRRVAPHQWHHVDSTMARDASNSLLDMNAVIEVHKIRQIVHPCPLDRLTRAKAFSNRLKLWTIRPDLRVTLHANLSRRNSGKVTCLDGRVTIAAIDPEASDMMFMTELNRLGADNTHLRLVG